MIGTDLLETFGLLKDTEIRQFGEYRPHGLMLKAWDRMGANGELKARGI